MALATPTPRKHTNGGDDVAAHHTTRGAQPGLFVAAASSLARATPRPHDRRIQDLPTVGATMTAPGAIPDTGDICPVIARKPLPPAGFRWFDGCCPEALGVGKRPGG